jgi:hypothetical protein
MASTTGNISIQPKYATIYDIEQDDNNYNGHSATTTTTTMKGYVPVVAKYDDDESIHIIAEPILIPLTLWENVLCAEKAHKIGRLVVGRSLTYNKRRVSRLAGFLLSVVTISMSYAQRPHTAVRVDGGGTKCTYAMPTSVCKNGRPVWEALHVQNWDDLDCLGYETVTDIIYLGKNGLVEWAQMCAELEPDASGRPLPTTLVNTTIKGYECLMATNNSIFVATVDEVHLARKNGALRCLPAEAATYIDLNPCVEDDKANSCIGTDFDWSTLVGAVRNDCFSRMIRDIFVNYDGNPPEELIPSCHSDRELLLHF